MARTNTGKCLNRRLHGKINLKEFPQEQKLHSKRETWGESSERFGLKLVYTDFVLSTLRFVLKGLAKNWYIQISY